MGDRSYVRLWVGGTVTPEGEAALAEALAEDGAVPHEGADPGDPAVAAFDAAWRPGQGDAPADVAWRAAVAAAAAEGRAPLTATVHECPGGEPDALCAACEAHGLHLLVRHEAGRGYEAGLRRLSPGEGWAWASCFEAEPCLTLTELRRLAADPDGHSLATAVEELARFEPADVPPLARAATDAAVAPNGRYDGGGDEVARFDGADPSEAGAQAEEDSMMNGGGKGR